MKNSRADQGLPAGKKTGRAVVAWAVLGGLLSACLADVPARAQSGFAPEDFYVRGWGTETGLTAGDIHDLARTADGFLWLATDAGLMCFDGSQFRILETNQLPIPDGDRATCLLADRQGGLWVGTGHGHLLHREAGGFQEAELNGLAGGRRFNSLAEGNDGSLWAAVARTGVLCCRQGKWRLAGPADGPVADGAEQVAVTADNRVWVVAGRQLFQWQGAAFAGVELPDSLPAGRIAGGRDGSLWVAATVTTTRGTRLFQFRQGHWREPFDSYPWLQASVWSVPNVLLADAAGRLWVGTEGSGMFYHAADGSWQSPSRMGPLVDDRVNALFQDQEGSVWFGLQGGSLFQAVPRVVPALRPDASSAQNLFQTACLRRDGSIWGGTYGGGIYCCQSNRWTHYGTEQGLANPYVSSLCEDHLTNLWAGTRSGLFRFDGNGFKRATFLPRPDAFVLALYEDRRGGLWASTHRGLVCRRQGETIREFGRYEGLETGPDIRAITEDPAGNIWATVMNIGIFRQRGDRFELFTADHLPRALDYRALHFDADGTLWVATYGDGLYQVAGGRVRHWTVRDGLPSNYLVALVEDREGTLWLGSVNGIIGLAGQALNEYVPGKSLPLLGRQLTVTEGLDSQICSGWGQPVAVCGPDGRLCFPNQRALAVFDPAAVHPSPLALPVSLEEVRVDGASVPLDGGSVVRVRSGARHIEFQYALPDLHSLARVRFRYRLRGLDDEWTTTQQGVAGYNFLSPGRYEFQVMASGPDGRWHGSVAPAGLVVEPRLWERTSVRITAAAVLAGLVVAAVWMVSRARMQRRLLRMEALQAAEQERRRIARDLHDELGSGLTEIMQLGDLGCEEGIVTDDLRGNARTIAQKTRRLAAALDEIVWTTNPGNDSLPKFSGYLCDYAQEFMRATPVRCRLDTVSLPDDILLQAAVRHNLLLACKEALRNAVRHSGAGEVWLRLRYEAGRFQIVIEDNGRGFTPDSLSGRGNGVRNMRERVELVGGQMKLASEPGKGCVLTFELPFPAAE